MTAGSALRCALLAFALLAGCASHANDPATTADKMTHAVYANDYDGFTSYFDDTTKATITRGDFGELSDRMHKMGELGAISRHDADPDKGRFTFDVTLTGGSMLVELRVDPTGKVGAYRVIPSK